LAAGQPSRLLGAVETEVLQQGAGLVRIVVGIETGLGISQRGGKLTKVGLLRQIADTDPWLQEALAAVGLQQPGCQPQQCRFARTVAPHQTDALAGGHGEFGAREQRRAAKGERDIRKPEQWWWLDHRRQCSRRSRADRLVVGRGQRRPLAPAAGPEATQRRPPATRCRDGGSQPILAALNLRAPHAIDKVVVVTGGASGIGLAIAKAVVSDGG